MNINQTQKLGSVTAEQRQLKAIETAHQFEAIFTQMMVQSFRKAQLSDDGGMFGSSVGSSTYEHWFDQHMSAHLAKNSGIGIADTLIRDFQRLGVLPKAEHGTKTTQAKGVNHVA